MEWLADMVISVDVGLTYCIRPPGSTARWRSSPGSVPFYRIQGLGNRRHCRTDIAQFRWQDHGVVGLGQLAELGYVLLRDAQRHRVLATGGGDGIGNQAQAVGGRLGHQLDLPRLALGFVDLAL